MFTITTTTNEEGDTITTAETGTLTLRLYDTGGAYSDIYAIKDGLDPYPIHTLNGWDYEKNEREESREEIIQEFTEWLENEALIYLQNMAPQFLR